jgi:RNA polymerase sigma-70 factor (ECF subfamily)
LETASRPSDRELLAATAAGSEHAFGELRRRYERAVRAICGSQAVRDLEDCVQEVFIRVWRKARLFDAGRGAPAAWLSTLARNVARNIVARRPPTPENVEPAATAAEPDVNGVWVRSAVARLPVDERHVIELAYFRDLSQAEIAAGLDMPLGTVKTRTRRGLGRLAGLLVAGESSADAD